MHRCATNAKEDPDEVDGELLAAMLDGRWRDRPSAAALQGEAANHRQVRRSRAGVLSVAEKARPDRVRCGP